MGPTAPCPTVGRWLTPGATREVDTLSPVYVPGPTEREEEGDRTRDPVS